MAVSVTSRKTIRDILYGYINDNLVGEGKYLKVFYNGEPDEKTLGGQSPAGWISSGNTVRDPRSINENVQSELNFLIVTAIRTDAGLSNNEVEDNLDGIEKQISDLFMDETRRVVSGSYNLLDITGATPGYRVIGGNYYRLEIYTVVVEVED